MEQTSGQPLPPKNLVVDVGNTRMKAGLFRSGKLMAYLEATTWPELNTWISIQQDGIGAAMVCQVGKPITGQIETAFPGLPVYYFTHETPIPLSNHYRTPHTLGMDRLAACLGAWQKQPHCHHLVIDAGTCLTFDFVTEGGVYEGGRISPGLQMRLQAMHSFTTNLPLATFSPDTPLIGTDTLTCLQSGAYYGMLGEIAYSIREFEEKFGQIQVNLSGGDAPFFESKLKPTIFVDRHLLLQGLNSVLDQYVK